MFSEPQTTLINMSSKLIKAVHLDITRSTVLSVFCQADTSVRKKAMYFEVIMFCTATKFSSRVSISSSLVLISL